MISKVLEAFLRDCRSRHLSPHTLLYYERNIRFFTQFCEANEVTHVETITPDFIRTYLISLEEDHNQGGVHAKYRALKVLLLWYEAEYEPENWKNPIRKVKAPKVPENEIKPVEVEDLLKLLKTCNGGTFADIRDKAIMLFLFDTGVRVQECVDVLLDDCDLWSGQVFIRKGKGGKSRTVYMGKISLRFVRKYMKLRTDKTPTLWVTSVGHPLAKKSVQGMLERRAEEAGIPVQSAHRFRKAFSTIMAEAASIFSLMSLTGDSMEVLQKHYVRRDVSTARAAHERGSPVDKLLP